MRMKVAFLAALLVWPGTAAFASELSPDLRSLISDSKPTGGLPSAICAHRIAISARSRSSDCAKR